MSKASVAERLAAVNPETELWWDSSPIVYQNWKKKMLDAAAPEDRPELEAQLTRFLNEEDITDLPMYMRARKGIGYLPQESSVFRKMTVEENIMAILESLSLSRSEREERLESLLNELGLGVIRDRKAYSLSGGERRRVEITRALVTSPVFIFLDEPFAGIDPIAVTDIQNIVFQLKYKGIGVIITDHNVRETLGICDRAYILNEGRILESGSPEKVAKSKKARRIYQGDSFTLDQKRLAEPVEERWN